MAIALAIWKRQVVFALFAGIWVGELIYSQGNPFRASAASLENLVELLSNRGDAQVLLFCLLAGSFLELLESGGGVRGLIEFLKRRIQIQDRRRGSLLTVAVGSAVFLETNLSCLVAGAVSRPIFDRAKMSRALTGVFDRFNMRAGERFNLCQMAGVHFY